MDAEENADNAVEYGSDRKIENKKFVSANVEIRRLGKRYNSATLKYENQGEKRGGYPNFPRLGWILFPKDVSLYAIVEGFARA